MSFNKKKTYEKLDKTMHLDGDDVGNDERRTTTDDGPPTTPTFCGPGMPDMVLTHGTALVRQRTTVVWLCNRVCASYKSATSGLYPLHRQRRIPIDELSAVSQREFTCCVGSD